MLGAIVGDVIDSPFEASNWKGTDFRFFAAGAQCTDDSILTLATADALLNGRDYRVAYQDYFHRFPKAGYGAQFVVWANRRRKQPYGSWGNGSAMRVSPIGWARQSLADVFEEAERSASVTHDHPEGILGAQTVAASVFLARTQQSRDVIRSFVEEMCGYPLTLTIDELRPNYAFDPSCRGTVPVAIQAFLESRGFEHAIRLAVSVGGDSDTIACITEAIAHAFYRGVPFELLDKTVNGYMPESLTDLALTFCEKFEVPL